MAQLDICRFSSLVLDDAWLRATLTFMDEGSLQFTDGDRRIEIAVRDGIAAGVAEATSAPDILLRIPPAVWEGLARNPPPPGFESATMAQRNGLVIEGDLERFVAPFHPAIERLYLLLGEALRGPLKVMATNAEPFRDTDDPIGRYRWVTVDGTDFRIYYETAGTGPVPLLLQHTAGGDSRQWRHLLADPVLQRDFTMIAYDLPYHGRSLPPTGTQWWHDQYRVSQK
ncbi:MAG: alpha/beta fold hydrolase, partial [Sphingopyxis sp.]